MITYFIAKASGRKRKKNKITSLHQEEGVVKGEDNILNYATNFYMKLFGPVDKSVHVSLYGPLDNVLDDMDRANLHAPFTVEEVKKNAVFQMKHNKAPGPDGFPIEFYQHFLPLICVDIMALFDEFYHGKLDLACLNYGFILLLPKCPGADRIQDYRPIFLLNVLFKIFTKVVNNRPIVVADKVISPVQTAFIRGRNILDGVVILHETLHQSRVKRVEAVLFKVDFKKAYDKINWDFLVDVLRMEGFSAKFVDWTISSIENGKVAIMVNGKVGPYFPTKKGLRQGNPFAPSFLMLM